MKNHPFISFVFVLLMSCNAADKQPSATSPDSAGNKKSVPTHNIKHVDWEIGDVNNVNKILELYHLWDKNTTYPITDYFADTLRLHIPDISGEIVVPNGEINTKLKANRAMYAITSNDVLSSVALHDKVTGEEWVMITAYSKWVEKDGTKDSLLYHDDWRLVNGKIDLLISFNKIPPTGFVKRKL